MNDVFQKFVFSLSLFFLYTSANGATFPCPSVSAGNVNTGQGIGPGVYSGCAVNDLGNVAYIATVGGNLVCGITDINGLTFGSPPPMPIVVASGYMQVPTHCGVVLTPSSPSDSCNYSSGMQTENGSAVVIGTHYCFDYMDSANRRVSISGVWLGNSNPQWSSRNQTYDAFLDQTGFSITANPSSILVGSTSTLTSNGGQSTGAVTYIVDSGDCTVNAAGIVTGNSVGTCMITGTKAGDADYNPATATVSTSMAIAPSTAGAVSLIVSYLLDDHPQFVTYFFDGSAWLAEAKQGGKITNISTYLNTLDDGTDSQINISPDGEWLLLESERFHDDCDGWACLIYGKRDLSEFSAVLASDGNVIHPEGFSAIANDGKLIVVHVSGTARNDLMVSHRTGNIWSVPVSLTAGSPSNNNQYPTISTDGQEVLFHCGENICIVNTDGSGLRTLLSLSDRPGGGSWEEIRSADFGVSGDIIFEADDGSERIWRYNQTSGAISMINALHTNDNSPCVLADGRIASLWLNRPNNSQGIHELKIMDGSGTNHFLVLQDQDISDFGLGCGGR